MIDALLEVYRCFSARQRFHFLILQILMLISSVVEVLGVTSIAPFMAVAVNPDLIQSNYYIKGVYDVFGFYDEQQFLLVSGLFFVCMIVVANFIQLVNIFCLNRFAMRIGGELAAQINSYYMGRGLLFFCQKNSSELVNNVIIECTRIGQDLIAPALRLNAKLFSMILLGGFLIWLNPLVAIVSVSVVSVSYFLIFRVVRRLVDRNGRKISENNSLRIRMLNEGYGGIKDIRLRNAERFYIDCFERATKSANRAIANNMILGQSPYYVMEALVFCGIMVIAMFFIVRFNGLGDALPVLALYAMAGYKLIPSFQQSYHALVGIRGTLPAYRAVRGDILASVQKSHEGSVSGVERIPFQKEIRAEGIYFRYPDRQDHVLKDVNFSVKFGQAVALVGASGAGKSTLVDLFLGLLSPTSGKVKIDDVDLGEGNVRSWWSMIGYVPQFIYLSDSTIAQNVAYGIDPDSIDMNKVITACRQACIDEFIQTLPDGFQTRIGERGVQLSGGQRQRLGIARALYHQPQILVFDEATSALDVETESKIMETISHLAGDKTILIVTHRWSTLDMVDVVYKLENGNISEVSTATMYLSDEADGQVGSER